MIGIIIASIVGLWLAAKNNPNAAAQQATPIIKDSTGGALTGALGQRARPPDYYATGNPQYNNMPPPKVPYRARPISQIQKPAMTTTRMKVVPVAPVVGTSEIARPTGALKPAIAGLMNSRQVSRYTTAPELAQPFWSRRLPTK
jgi:hypothetical protein